MTQVNELVDKDIKRYCNYILYILAAGGKNGHITKKAGRLKKRQKSSF